MPSPRRHPGCALLLASLAGCAGPQPEPRSPPSSAGVAAALDQWVAAEHESAAAAAPGVRRSRALAPVASGPAVLRASPPPPPRPPRGSRVDIEFQRADINHALQLLADAGRFNLVVESGLTGQVSARFHRVDPYDALLSIVGANGAEAHFEGNIVVVRKR